VVGNSEFYGDVSVNGNQVNSLTLATAQNVSGLGTSVNFTGIPSWVKRITVMFNGVSTDGSSDVQVQLGAGSVTTSGYAGSCIRFSSSSGTGGDFTTGFVIRLPSASFARNGNMTCSLLGSNAWSSNYNFGTSNNETALGAGSVTLSGTLDRIRITTVNGTDTFDAGTVNILFEG
jgi:hypothetical protein